MKRCITLAVAMLAASGCATVDRLRARNALDDTHASALRRAGSAAELDAVSDAWARFRKLSEPRPKNRRWRWRKDVDREELETIMVVGSRIERADVEASQPVFTITSESLDSASITRTQELAVDEGDLVKMSGRALVVLRHGVLHAIATGTAGAPQLAVTDSERVAQDPTGETVWYDEILANGDTVVLLGYNYGQGAAELIVYRLDAGGRFERTGRYWLRSDDYYSGENYGARLVGSRLLLNLPLSLADGTPDAWPSWSARDAATPTWTALVEPDDIYLPIAASTDPTINVVVSCPITELDRSDLDCRSVGVVGSGAGQVYATTNATYVATTERDERAIVDGTWRQYLADDRSFTAIYRIPHDAQRPVRVARVQGRAGSQFGFKELRGTLYVATETGPWSAVSMLLHRLPDAAFADRLDGRAERLAEVPVAQGGALRRFTDDALWIGFEDGGATHEVLVQPLSRDPLRRVPMPHGTSRFEPDASRMIVSGRSSAPGFSITTLDTRSLAIEGTLALPDREEAEWLSHAFNLGVVRGDTLFGLPTQPVADDAALTDLDFFRATSVGPVPAGRLEMQDQRVDGNCDGCDEFYGNARLFFVGERIFGLSGSLLKEAEYDGALIREVRRVELPGWTAGR